MQDKIKLGNSYYHKMSKRIKHEFGKVQKEKLIRLIRTAWVTQATNRSILSLSHEDREFAT